MGRSASPLAMGQASAMAGILGLSHLSPHQWAASSATSPFAGSAAQRSPRGPSSSSPRCRAPSSDGPPLPLSPKPSAWRGPLRASAASSSAAQAAAGPPAVSLAAASDHSPAPPWTACLRSRSSSPCLW
jgi:hypothetical protein